MKKLAALLFSSIFLTGCSNPGIVQISPDTYMLVREDYKGIFGSRSSLEANVIKDANAFAASKGKIAIPLSTNFKPLGQGMADWASFKYQFRVVDTNDPEVGRISLVPRADIVIEKHENIDAKVTTINDSKDNKDRYLELIKLDDLYKKSILTKEEFNKEKQKLLQQ